MSFILHCYWVKQLTLKQLTFVVIVCIMTVEHKATAFSGECFLTPLHLFQRGGTLYDFKYAQVRRAGGRHAAYDCADECGGKGRKVMWGSAGTSWVYVIFRWTGDRMGVRVSRG